MKILYIAIVVGAVFLSSCARVLDTQPYDKISEDIVWSTRANAETFIYATYGIMGSFQSIPGSDDRTINIFGTNSTSFLLENFNNNSDFGFNNWAAVRRCNLIIQKVSESSGIAEADKPPLIAEAKFLRAMSYYNIARNTGRIVWIDKLLSEDADFFLPSTKNPSESYHYIIADLEEAVKHMSTAKVNGRANKYTAAAFLTEIYLQSLAYKNYPDPPNVNSSEPLLDSVISKVKLVESGGYTLTTDYGSLFNEVGATNSPEIIFATYALSVNTTCASTPMQRMMPNLDNPRIATAGGSPALNVNRIFEAWGTFFPSYNFVDNYLVADKADPTKALPWDKTSQYMNAVQETVASFGSIPAGGTIKPLPVNAIPRFGTTNEPVIKSGIIKPESNETVWTLTNVGRDARWAASIISDSTLFYGETLTTCVNGNATRWMRQSMGSIGIEQYHTRSNMYWKKGVYGNLSPKIRDYIPTNYHYVLTRLGRVYLNMAEAYLLKEDVRNAVIYLNKTRVTHGKLPPSQATNLTDAWIDYKRERRVDLVMEDDYYFSLLRWGRYGGNANSGIASTGTIPELEEVMKVMDISKDRKSFAILYANRGSGVNYDMVMFDESRRYLGPIAQSWINQNANFGPQNPGW